tara:strand:- start:2424 stop:2603 length:180 start_codon:yes stop_codon:yes gene_type:complete
LFTGAVPSTPSADVRIPAVRFLFFDPSYCDLIKGLAGALTGAGGGAGAGLLPPPHTLRT